MKRIVAIDIARGLAVLGMFTAHLGHEVDREPAPAWLAIADGRSAALFAILAGVSIALFTGRRTPPTGPALTRARLRVLTRAGAILVLGVLLTMLGTPVAVILPYYAVTFLLLVPVLRARPWLALTLAGVMAVVGPTLVALMTTDPAGGESWLVRTIGTDEGYVLDLLVTGYYPALAWIAYMLLGLGVGRLDLGSATVHKRLVISGVSLALVGYLVADALVDWLGPDISPFAERFVRAEPHDDSTLELLGNSGVALAVLGALLYAANVRAVRVVLYPVAATGAMALSAYAIHIVAIAILGNDVVWRTESNAILGWFILVTLVAATAWHRWLGRGPFERVLSWVSVGAAPAPAPAPSRVDSETGGL